MAKALKVVILNLFKIKLAKKKSETIIRISLEKAYFEKAQNAGLFKIRFCVFFMHEERVLVIILK